MQRNAVLEIIVSSNLLQALIDKGPLIKGTLDSPKPQELGHALLTQGMPAVKSQRDVVTALCLIPVPADLARHDLIETLQLLVLLELFPFLDNLTHLFILTHTLQKLEEGQVLVRLFFDLLNLHLALFHFKLRILIPYKSDYLNFIHKYYLLQLVKIVHFHFSSGC